MSATRLREIRAPCRAVPSYGFVIVVGRERGPINYSQYLRGTGHLFRFGRCREVLPG